MKRKHLVSRICDAFVVVDDIVRDSQAFLPAGLGGQYGPGLLFGLAVTGHQAPELRLLTAVDDQYPVYECPER